MKQFSQEYQRDLVEKLDRLLADKVRSEESTRASRAARDAAAIAQCEQAKKELIAASKAQQESLSSELTRRLAELTRNCERVLAEHAASHQREAGQIEQQSTQIMEEAERARQNTRSRADAAYDVSLKAATTSLGESQATVEEGRAATAAARADVDRVLARRRCRRPAAQLPPPEPVTSNQPLAFFEQQLVGCRESIEAFSRQWAARFLGSGWLFVIFVFTWIGFVLIGTALGVLQWPWAIAGGAVGLGVSAMVYVLVRPIAVRQTLHIYSAFRQYEVNAQKALDGVKAWAVAEADRQRLALRRTRDQQLHEADQAFERKRLQRRAEAAKLQQAIDEQLQHHRQQLTRERTEQQQIANREYDQRFQDVEREFEQQLRELEANRERQRESGEAAFVRSRERLETRWREGIADFQGAVDFAREYCRRYFPPWDSLDVKSLAASAQDAPAVAFGEYLVPAAPLGDIEGLGPLRDDGTLSVPALHTFSDRPAMLWETWGAGREAASRAMCNVMLRLLTSLPPGKTRFTIIDPVGLGQNFSAFMHLADLDEKLINHRIWTEPNHINQRLADLTEHMEDIIQTYLRNEYSTIDEYNRQAGEVSEPFRVLVVANFPAGFSEESASRLLSIANSGGKCGVFSLISTDSRLELPRDFDLADLEANALTIQWTGSDFCWLDPVLRELPLNLGEPPDDERFTAIVRAAGELARDSNRVEVPFRTVAPPDGEWWTGDSRREVTVALGRAGASKLQQLELGKGTSQHVLISGKTGSGKSTLLHALIMNAALHYSPAEIQFYLVDFKKGVEFKPYAHHRLPHAQVVAIESEREFGVSVLQRLDGELRRRGDLFRDRGVQDIAAFRDANPAEAMPRLLLIVDEFQELFVQDDKLAQEAGLLLDRLVRQGRAFGIHVLLGSQTLAGAYSLARSTIGQMAIRIALQCSEADSHLILSEDNTAARLLERPGEAIYNNENGRFEGNHPFQVVWLGAQAQEDYLSRLADFASERAVKATAPIIFEGNTAANPAENPLLLEALTSGSSDDSPPQAWLGAAVAIKDPTAAIFPQQSGSNLVVVGQQADAAFALLANAVVSLVATAAGGPSGSQFVVFDGSRAGAAAADWRSMARALPGKCEVVAAKALNKRLAKVHAALKRRMGSPEASQPQIFCTIFHLSGLRELRRAESDFGFGGSLDDAQTPAQQLVEILCEGPAHGIHCLIWCDTFNSLNRWFDRQVLRELDQRVLFQMSNSDSSNLMDSPLASRLGNHRAILYSEERGTQEKFRPYALPTEEWLEQVRERLRMRSKNASVA